MKNTYALLIVLLFTCSSWSQEYRDMISAGTYTVQEIQEVAEAFFEEVGTERGKGYKPYKRWEYQALQNMDENGMLKTPDFYFEELEEYNNYINQNFSATRTVVGTWEQMGPYDWNATSGWNPGVGRITSMAFESGNLNHIIVGSQTGGVWRTIDGGQNWTVLTDNLSNLIVYSITIMPGTPTTYFWGSSNGVIFKSTDSGSTWNLLADIGNGRVNKILIDPNDTDKMFCSSEGGGIFKSTDGGDNWSVIHPSAGTDGYDIEFKPGDTNTIYAAGNSFFKSTDGGDTFTIPTLLGFGAKMIAVPANATANSADASIVYVLAESGSVFDALYKSTDGGDNFTELNHAGKNYFGYSSTASDNSGQAPRDMDIVVNPDNADEVHIAGVLTWRSLDGGVNFNITSQWTPGGASSENIGYCHADVDMLEYFDGKLFVASDGGIFRADNPTAIDGSGGVGTGFYTDITNGMGIKQFYRIGITQSNPVIVSGGSQDNGASILDDNGNWTDWLGADGMETFVDKNDNNIVYGTSQFGTLYRSNQGGVNAFGLPEPDGKSGNWITPFEQDPVAQNTIYSGYDQVYKSTNGGSNWGPISQNFGIDLDHLKIAPSNTNTMYASAGFNLYRTQDGGATNWSQLNGFSGSITSIAIHPTDENKIAIATTGAQKVYVSTDGGDNWTSYLSDLPNFSARALTWFNNGQDGLYLGMNYGVYFRDNTTNGNWLPFSNNLPNVIISELEINYVDEKLYAATYGRGLWRSDLYNALSNNEFAFDGLSMYPNPTSNEVNLQWQNNSNEVSIRIYNQLGKIMHYTKKQSLSNEYKIDISNYASGIYFVKINNQKGFTTKKLIVD